MQTSICRISGNFVSVFKNSEGNANVDTKVSGVMGDLSVNDLHVNYLNTHLNAKGRIYNLDSPGRAET